MTPGQAAFECWYAQMAGIREISPDAWKSLGAHQEMWDAVANAAIDAHIEAAEADPQGLGPIARDMDPDELAAFRARRAKD